MRIEDLERMKNHDLPLEVVRYAVRDHQDLINLTERLSVDARLKVINALKMLKDLGTVINIQGMMQNQEVTKAIIIARQALTVAVEGITNGKENQAL